MDQLTELLTQLRALPGIAAADVEPDKLNVFPAVLVQLSTLDAPMLDGTSLQLMTRLSIVVDDGPAIETAQQLVDAFAGVLLVVTPDDVPAFTVVELPGSAPRPALAFRLQMSVTPSPIP